MRNPYEVLGVPQGASIEQVKAAYRELMRRSHEAGAPQSRIEELNDAYDAIIMSGSSASSNSQYNTYTSFTDYSDIRNKINLGRLDDAQTLLDGVPEYSRDAQWYYLKGTIQQKRGWLEEAANNFSKACDMDPSNNTYKMAFNKVNNARSGGYKTERRSGGNSGCSGCDICSGLLCADCCCECFGGDLIPCC
ncbi:MAG: molecular chaperone DnaJ [Clostridia bacterium]|nr:molecular chaperone DnaJ [Clostridia bacterium]